MSAQKILLVDDDKDFLDSCKIVLESKQYNVLTAGSADEAIAVFEQNNPGLILLDLMMEKPDSGIELCKKFRETDKTAKIYLLSAVGEQLASNIDIKNIGFNGAIEKPIKPAELLDLANTGDK